MCLHGFGIARTTSNRGEIAKSTAWVHICHVPMALVIVISWEAGGRAPHLSGTPPVPKRLGKQSCATPYPTQWSRSGAHALHNHHNKRCRGQRAHLLVAPSSVTCTSATYSLALSLYGNREKKRVVAVTPAPPASCPGFTWGNIHRGRRANLIWHGSSRRQHSRLGPCGVSKDDSRGRNRLGTHGLCIRCGHFFKQ